MSERAKRIANECVGWFSPKLTRAEAELEITKIIEREMITISISDINAIPCEHRSADFGFRCSLAGGREGEHHFSIAPPPEQAPWRIKDKLAAAERERDEARAALTAETDNLHREIERGDKAVMELSDANWNLAQRDRRIADMQQALLHAKRCGYSSDLLDAALSAPAQPATATKECTCLFEHEAGCQRTVLPSPATTMALRELETKYGHLSTAGMYSPPSPAAREEMKHVEPDRYRPCQKCGSLDWEHAEATCDGDPGDVKADSVISSNHQTAAMNADPSDDEITPGVRKLVRFLRSAGFKTIDSGDGVTNVEAGMEGALELPHVHIMTTRDTMIAESHRLQNTMDAVSPGGACQVQAMYDPLDGIATLSVFGVADKDLGL